MQVAFCSADAVPAINPRVAPNKGAITSCHRPQPSQDCQMTVSDTPASTSTSNGANTPANDDALFLNTVEGEITFFRSLMRARPVGVHRYFHVLAIRNAIYKDVHRVVSVDAIWDKLRSCYNLEALEAAVRLSLPLRGVATHILVPSECMLRLWCLNYRTPNTKTSTHPPKTPFQFLSLPHPHPRTSPTTPSSAPNSNYPTTTTSTPSLSSAACAIPLPHPPPPAICPLLRPPHPSNYHHQHPQANAEDNRREARNANAQGRARASWLG